MQNEEKAVRSGKSVVIKEKQALKDLEKRFSSITFKNNFAKAVNTIYYCKGKVVVTGIGKSGIIAQKIVATFNSTGTYSTFLHSADSIHGDLGIVKKEDVVILVSKSGSTPEIKRLIPILKEIGVTIISITGNNKSYLAINSDIVIDSTVKEEACPLNLAPTSSSTTALVIGDALAIALLDRRGFTEKDFAAVHPGGTLGRRLLLKVEDIMIKGKDIPIVNSKTPLKDTIYMISSKRLGCTIVKDNSKILGIITDGDIRRLLEKDINIQKVKARDIMTTSPKIINSDTLAKTALEIMEKNKITQLIVVDKHNRLAGIVHIHTLVELGI